MEVRYKCYVLSLYSNSENYAKLIEIDVNIQHYIKLSLKSNRKFNLKRIKNKDYFKDIYTNERLLKK